VRQEQLAAITALINGLDVSDFEDYVTGVSFGNIPTPFVIDLVGGEEAPQETKSTITLRPNITAQQMQDAFDSARDFVRDAREGNIEPAPIPVHTTEVGNIQFFIHGNATEAEIEAYKAEILALDVGHLYWIAPYIKSWTLVPEILVDGVPQLRDFKMVDDNDAEHGQRGAFRSIGGLELRNDLAMARAEIRTKLGLDDNGNDDPTYVERESTDSSGNTIRFQGDADNAELFAAIRAEAEALTDEQINRYAAHIDIVVQLPADGAWGDEGRWVMYEPGQGRILFRDGTAGTLAEDLTYAYDYITNQNGNAPEPAYVMTRDSTDFGSISFYADETIDTNAFINAINEILGNIFNSFSEFISTVKQLPDGALGGEIKVESDGEGRVIMWRDGPVDMMALLMDMLGVVEEQLQAASANAFMRGRDGR